MAKEELLWNFIWFLFGFLVVFCVMFGYYKWQYKHRKRKQIMELEYLKKKFHLEEKDVSGMKMIVRICLLNAFIISFVWTFISMVPVGIFWQLIIAFVLVLALTYSIYEIYGRHLEKRKKDNEE